MVYCFRHPGNRSGLHSEQPNKRNCNTCDMARQPRKQLQAEGVPDNTVRLADMYGLEMTATNPHKMLRSQPLNHCTTATRFKLATLQRCNATKHSTRLQHPPSVSISYRIWYVKDNHAAGTVMLRGENCRQLQIEHTKAICCSTIRCIRLLLRRFRNEQTPAAGCPKTPAAADRRAPLRTASPHAADTCRVEPCAFVDGQSAVAKHDLRASRC